MNADLLPTAPMRLDPSQVGAVGQCRTEAAHVEPGHLGVARQCISASVHQLLPMGEQQMIHGPELALRGRCFGRLGGKLCMGMFHQWKVPEDESQAVSERIDQMLGHWLCFTARRALIVAILEQEQRGPGGTCAVVGVENARNCVQTSFLEDHGNFNPAMKREPTPDRCG